MGREKNDKEIKMWSAELCVWTWLHLFSHLFITLTKPSLHYIKQPPQMGTEWKRGERKKELKNVCAVEKTEAQSDSPLLFWISNSAIRI